MGASCSTANISLSTLPEDLVIEILSNFAVPDLISARRVNHYLKGVVDRSERLQHHIDTAVAGVLDNPNSSLSLRERRDALARRQEAWDTLQPQRTMSTTHQSRDDFFELDGTWLPLDPLREGHHIIKQLAPCPENDGLVAIGLRCGDVLSHNYLAGTYSLEVDILCFSGSGGEPLWTRKRTIHVKDVARKNGVTWGMNVEIHTKLLAVHLIPESTMRGWPDKELWIFDWETGEKIASLKGKKIHAFTFLSSSIIVVARVSPSESTATLELYRISGSSAIEKVAALGLPFVDIGCRIARVDFYPSHVKNLRTQGDRNLLYNASIDAKPFISPKSDSIIFTTLNIGNPHGYDNISFIIHPSALLRYTLPSHSYGHMEFPIPWESWGPSVTRWYEGGTLCGGGPITCGERCLLPPPWHPAPWELWDFNPYRVRRLVHCPSVDSDSETACFTVEIEPSCIKSQGIKEGVYSSLPFVKLVPKKWPEYDYMGLYEDKVIGEVYSYSTDQQNYVVERLHFG